MARRRPDPAAKLIGTLIALPFQLIALIFKAFTRPSFTSINFARQGSGGRFRRVTRDEVAATMQPVIDLVRQAQRLSERSGTMAVTEAEAILDEAHRIADKIDAACDRYERENYSFAYRRDAKVYERLIVQARQVARDLRKSTFTPEAT